MRQQLRMSSDEAPQGELPDHGRHQHRKYALSCEEFDLLWHRSGGRCEICGVLGRYSPHGSLHIDHNALLGDWAVRGLLCSRCNTMLGVPGRIVGPEVDRYLATPWRVTQPERLKPAVPAASLQGFGEVCAEYRTTTTAKKAALAALEAGVCRRIGARTETELVNATGLTRERIRQIIAAEEKRRAE